MISVLDVPFYDKDIATAIAQVLDDIQSNTSAGQNRCISASGAHGLIEANKKNAFKKILQSFYINLPDGMPVVWVGRIKGRKQMQRCYGPDFFKALLLASSDKPVYHFFCGGKEGVADELRQFCRTNLHNHNITGVYSPPFGAITDEEMLELGKLISDSGAHIVWVGLSTPKQEAFARRLTGFVQAHYIVTVGAAFDFHTGKVRQAPKWMQSAGLEWFFRLLMEPRRLYKRYFEIVPMFIYLNIKEFFYFYLAKSDNK